MNDIEMLEMKINDLNGRIEEICKKRDVRESCMPDEYYIVLRERQEADKKLRSLYAEKAKEKQHEKREVNDYGEKTERYITSDTYERALRRTEKAVLRNMGYA